VIISRLGFAVSQLVEQVFEDMREFLDVMNFNDARGALDGVGGAEYRVDGFGIVVTLFHAQQAIFHGRELFAGFLGKDAVEFFHRGSPSSVIGGSVIGRYDHGVAEKGVHVEKIDDFAHGGAVGNDAQRMAEPLAFALGHHQ
jgi:hypothetical protein